MLYSSKSNYRKRNIGIISAIIVALFSAVYLAYAIWPPKSYFLKVEAGVIYNWQNSKGYTT